MSAGIEEEENRASKEGAFRTHFTTDIIRRRAIQTAINKHVEGDTISWPQEQLSLSPSSQHTPGLPAATTARLEHKSVPTWHSLHTWQHDFEATGITARAFSLSSVTNLYRSSLSLGPIVPPSIIEGMRRREGRQEGGGGEEV